MNCSFDFGSMLNSLIPNSLMLALPCWMLLIVPLIVIFSKVSLEKRILLTLNVKLVVAVAVLL